LSDNTIAIEQGDLYMRSKLLVLLGMLVAFSTASYAQTATETQSVTTNLTEIRQINLTGGAITIPIKRSADGLTPYADSSATFSFDHDLIINQKVMVSAALTGTVGNWVDRNLWVHAEDAGAVAYWNTYGAVATQALIVNAVPQAAATLLSNPPQNQTGAATGPLTLNYSGGAGPTAVIGDASADVTYNNTDM
jgi:hypothetical protein